MRVGGLDPLRQHGEHRLVEEGQESREDDAARANKPALRTATGCVLEPAAHWAFGHHFGGGRRNSHSLAPLGPSFRGPS